MSVSSSSISLPFLFVVMTNRRLADLHPHLHSFRIQWFPTPLTSRHNHSCLSDQSFPSPKPDGTRQLNPHSTCDSSTSRRCSRSTIHPSSLRSNVKKQLMNLRLLNHDVLFRLMLNLCTLRSPNTSSSTSSTTSATLYMTLNTAVHPQY